MTIRLTVAAIAACFLVGCSGFSTPQERSDAAERADELIRVAAQWRAEAVAEREQGNDDAARALEAAARGADAAAGVQQGIANEDPAGAVQSVLGLIGESVPSPAGDIIAGVGALALAEWLRRQRQQAQLAGTLVTGINDSGGPTESQKQTLESLMTPKQKRLVKKIKATA